MWGFSLLLPVLFKIKAQKKRNKRHKCWKGKAETVNICNNLIVYKKILWDSIK